MDKACLVIGEALVDEVTNLDGRQERIFGGSPANTALAFSRLGLKSFFKGRISSDEVGQAIKEYLSQAGVDISQSIEVPDRALIIQAKIQQDGAASYFANLMGCSDFGWQNEELSDNLPSDVEVVHLGSLAAVTEPGASAIENWIASVKQNQQAAISFDPNIRPNLVTDPEGLKDRVERLVKLSDLVKLSHEDLNWLAPGQSHVDFAKYWLSLGVKAVIVTKAEQGASLFVQNDLALNFPAEKVQLVDTIGAGDTFTAALLTQLIENNLISKNGLSSDISIDTWSNLIKNSLIAATITCSRAGANPPTRSEVNW